MSPIKNNVKNAPDTEHKVEYVKRSILTLLNTGETKCERKAVKYSLVAIFIVLLALLTINFGISAIDASPDKKAAAILLFPFRIARIILPIALGLWLGKSMSELQKIRLLTSIKGMSDTMSWLSAKHFEFMYYTLSEMKCDDMARHGYEALLAAILLRYPDLSITCENGLPANDAKLSFDNGLTESSWKLPDVNDMKILQFKLVDNQKTVSLLS